MKKIDQNTVPINLPRNITLRKADNSITIRQRWTSTFEISIVGMFAFLMDLCVVWAIHNLSITDNANDKFIAPYILTPFFIAGVYSTYYTLMLVFNTTRITACPSGLTVSVGPIPWFGNKCISTQSIPLIFGDSYRDDSFNRTLYALCFLNKRSKKVELLDSIPYREQADYLAKLMNTVLGKIAKGA